MKHLSNIEVVSFIDNELDRETRRQVKVHLSACSRCANKHMKVKTTIKVVGEALRSEVGIALVRKTLKEVEKRGRR